jgi:hypothetical protein
LLPGILKKTGAEVIVNDVKRGPYVRVTGERHMPLGTITSRMWTGSFEVECDLPSDLNLAEEYIPTVDKGTRVWGGYFIVEFTVISQSTRTIQYRDYNVQ